MQLQINDQRFDDAEEMEQEPRHEHQWKEKTYCILQNHLLCLFKSSAPCISYTSLATVLQFWLVSVRKNCLCCNLMHFTFSHLRAWVLWQHLIQAQILVCLRTDELRRKEGVSKFFIVVLQNLVTIFWYKHDKRSDWSLWKYSVCSDKRVWLIIWWSLI